MKIVDPQASQTRPYSAQLAEDVLGRFQDGAASFSAIRAAMGKTAKQLPDGWIHQICIDAGLVIVP